jgi:hypothetical protein
VRNHAWSAPSSCPICLEDFNPPPTPKKAPGEGPSSPGAADRAEAGPSGSGVSPADSPKAALLPGGGSSSSSSSGSGQLSQREAGLGGGLEEAGPSSGGGSGAGGVGGIRRRSVGKGLSEDSGQGAGGAGAARPKRVPITLACGHTFCDPCEWQGGAGGAADCGAADCGAAGVWGV